MTLYNNQIIARALIGQLSMVYSAGKPMEKSRFFCIIKSYKFHSKNS